MMTGIEPTTRNLLNSLQAGERIEVVHQVKVGQQRWTTRVAGVVERVTRRRHGLHFRRNLDDKVFSDEVTLRLDDGSVSSLSIDEFTEIKRLAG